jgi:uncharacterized protein YdcH (DUF465 family)
MKCTKCQRNGHRARDCHKYPTPALELMEEDEEAPLVDEDGLEIPSRDDVCEFVAYLILKHEEGLRHFHERENKRMEEKLESRFHATNEHVRSLRSLLTEAMTHLTQQDKHISGLAEKLNGTNDRLDQLTAENRALRAEVAELRKRPLAPPPQPPPPPPLHAPRPNTPPQPKRKRDPAVGATPRKPTKQPRDISPTRTSSASRHAAMDVDAPSPTPASPTEDQGWTEVKKKRRNKPGDSKGKSGKKAHTPKGRSEGWDAPTWAQVAQGGGVHVTVYYGSGNPKPAEARPPTRRKGKGKERKANGSGPEGRKEAEEKRCKLCSSCFFFGGWDAPQGALFIEARG